MEVRSLRRDEAELLREIDRAERIAERYVLAEGRLVLVPDRCEVTAWDAAELDALVARQRALHAAGGALLGAFEGGRVAGFASVDARLRGPRRERAELDVLYVSRPDRGKGVGRALVRRAAEVARGYGACSLYVSATPTRATVDFYLGCGARLAAPPDPELAALEPEDVPLELAL